MCVSLRAEGTAGRVLVCFEFVWLSFTAVYQFSSGGKHSFWLDGAAAAAAVTQVPIQLSCLLVFLNTDSGKSRKASGFVELSTSTVLLILQLKDFESLEA